MCIRDRNRATKIGISSGGAGYGSGAAGDLYNAKLVSIGSSTTGEGATAKLTVNGSGTITAVKLMDGGSSYGIGNTLNVVGVATTSGFVQAVVEVEKIYNNVGDVVKISGVSSESYAGYNQLYRITGVDVGVARSVTVASASAVSGFATIGISSEAQIPVGVGYGSDLEKVEKVTQEVIDEIQNSLEETNKNYQPAMRFQNFGESSINLMVYFRGNRYGDQNPIINSFIKLLHKKYAEAGIEIPFPMRTIIHKNEKQ